MMTRLFVAFSAILPCFSAVAQSLEVRVHGGALGQNLRSEVRNAQPNGVLLQMLGLDRGQLPIALIDPADPRVVGITVLEANLGLLDATGFWASNLTVPPSPAFAGLSIAQQIATGPGQGTAIDELSQVVAAPVGASGAFAAEASTLGSPRSFATPIRLGDGRVLIVGGGTGQLLFQNAVDSTEIWDAIARTIQPGPTMVAARSAHTQTRLQDGRYLLVGGVDATNTPQTSCEIFDPQSGSFSPATSMSVVRAHHTAVLLSDGRVWIAGGIRNMSFASAAVTSSTASTEIYDPASDTWSAGPNLTRPRGGHMAAHLGNGKVMLCGGMSWTSFFGFITPNLQSRTELYDEATNSMSVVASMTTPRALAGTIPLPNGRVLVVGGMTGNITSGGVPTALCESFDPATNTWSASPSRAVPIAFPVCATLTDGALVAVGGADGDLYGPLPNPTCERLDPATGRWTLLPPLSTARAAATVVPLDSGGMAVFGGSATSAASSVDSVELLIR